MSRALFSWAALAVFVSTAGAQQTAAVAETLIRLTVQPAAAPKPALRILLLPEMREMNPGNPIQHYYKSFMEQHKFFFDKEAVAHRDRLLAMPLKALPARDLQDYGRAALSLADEAARLDKPDWQILLKIRTDGVGLLLPDIQQLRTLANALKVRFRAEVALGRFDDANRTAKTMFALARHFGDHPTLIGHLVGLAIAYVAVGPLEEMLEQPGCPNLYWALTNLPRPLVAIDKSMEGERMFIAAEFRNLDANAPLSAEQVKKLIAHIDAVLASEPTVKPGSRTRNWLDERTKDPAKVRDARRRLVESGLPEERVGRFPVEQVFLLDEVREYEEARDDAAKLLNFPSWQVDALYEKTKPVSKNSLFAYAFVPAVQKVHQAHGRLEQRIGLLRHVEAVRLYAAEHAGKLPATLAELSVPLPDDPFTGKPFRYSIEGNTFHLRGSPPRGMEKISTYNIHYEVTVQKSGGVPQ